jgi:hypothetical protein
MERFELTLVRGVESLKRIFHCHTWQVEQMFVFLVLASVAITRLVVTGHGWVEWLGVFAVSFTAQHASVAKDMEYRERRRVEKGGKAEVHCYAWLQRYFYLKESFWLAYFLIVEAYSALAGVAIFLFLGWWWKVWQKHRPGYIDEL